MEIRINDHKLDVNLENEKTIGDILYSLEQWLDNSGHRLSAISVDGQSVSVSMMEEVFLRDINAVKQLDIYTNIIADLAAESLFSLLDDIKEYENLSFAEKTKFFNAWKDSAQANFIRSQMDDLYSLCENAFCRGEINSASLSSIAQERLREIKDPLEEFEKTEPLINEICERLVRLPLDIQTGKDSAAAQTIQVFSAVTEKIFRIFRELAGQGYINDEKETGNKEQIIEQLTNFGNVLKELLDAYEKNDSVLIGDIAEYEASPNLNKLYLTIKNNVKAQVKK